jgi:hypothetical protein
MYLTTVCHIWQFLLWFLIGLTFPKPPINGRGSLRIFENFRESGNFVGLPLVLVQEVSCGIQRRENALRDAIERCSGIIF